MSIGFLALLTPCVFPMIPLTVSYFANKKNNKKPFLDAFVFGLSIIIIFTFLGIFFFFFGVAVVVFIFPPWAMLAPPSSAFGLGPNEAFILLPSFVNSTLRSFKFSLREGQACIVTVADSFFY